MYSSLLNFRIGTMTKIFVFVMALLVFQNVRLRYTSQVNAHVTVIISDHGYGHAGRMCGVIDSLLKHGADVHIISGVSLEFFVEYLGERRFEYTQMKIDVGLLQSSAVVVDMDRTLVALRTLFETMDERIDKVVQSLHSRTDVILYDIGALAPLVAERIGVKCVGISNFSWDIIYAPLAPKSDEFTVFAELHAKAYAKSTHMIYLPFSAPMPAFKYVPSTTIDWIGRQAAHSKQQTRNVLNLSNEKKYMLLTFGAQKQELDVNTWTIPSDFRVVRVVNTVGATSVRRVGSVIEINLRAEELRHLTFVDILASMDCVVTKTGYGTVSESIVHGVPVLFLRHPDFAESPYLIEALLNTIRSQELHLQKLIEGHPEVFQNATRVIEQCRAQNCSVGRNPRGNDEAALITIQLALS